MRIFSFSLSHFAHPAKYENTHTHAYENTHACYLVYFRATRLAFAATRFAALLLFLLDALSSVCNLQISVKCGDFAEVWSLEKRCFDRVLAHFPRLQKPMERLLSLSLSRELIAKHSSSCDDNRPKPGCHIGNSLFRCLSLQYDDCGLIIPITALIEDRLSVYLYY